MTRLLSYSNSAVLFVAGLFFLMGAQVSQAYFTTNQQEVTLDGHTGYFLIEFKFGHGSHDIHIPIFATNGEGETAENMLSYEITDRFGNIGGGVASGMVLSTAKIEDGMYVVPKGTAATFTLFVTYTPEDGTERNKYRAHVTHLPFSFDGTEQLYLKPTELDYYETHELTLE